MANDPRTIGEKLRAMEERAGIAGNMPPNQPGNKEPAEGPRENAGDITNRAPSAEQQRQKKNAPKPDSRQKRT